MNKKLLKFSQVKEKRCECCGYLGDLGTVVTVGVNAKTWHKVIVVVLFCFGFFPGLFALIVYFMTKDRYDVLWCPQCGEFTCHDMTESPNKMMSFCLKDIDETLLVKKDKNFLKEMVRVQANKLNLV